MIQQYSKADGIAFARQAARDTANGLGKPDWIKTYERMAEIPGKGAAKYICFTREYANAYYAELSGLEAGRKKQEDAIKGQAALAEGIIS